MEECVGEKVGGRKEVVEQRRGERILEQHLTADKRRGMESREGSIEEVVF